MVNQNPQPTIFTISRELQAGEEAGPIELTHRMGSPEQMKIYAIYAHIFPGFLDIGPSDEYPYDPGNGQYGRRTWTDIDPVYIPTLDNPSRPNDSGEPDPLYVTLPLCCDPRPWTDVDLQIMVGSNSIPTQPIDLSIIHAKHDKTLILTSPIFVLWSQRLYVKLKNNNPVSPDWDTFTKVKVMLNGEVVNEEDLRQHRLAMERRMRG